MATKKTNDENRVAFYEKKLEDYTLKMYGDGQEYKVFGNIGHKSILLIVNNILTLCTNSETGEYIPVAKELAIRICTIGEFTNIKVPHDTGKCFELAFNTGVYESICSIHESICSEIRSAAEDAIRAKEKRLRLEPISRIMDFIDSITYSLQNALKDVDISKLSELAKEEIGEVVKLDVQQ